MIRSAPAKASSKNVFRNGAQILSYIYLGAFRVVPRSLSTAWTGPDDSHRRTRGVLRFVLKQPSG